MWKSIIKNDNSLIVAKVIAQNTSPDGPSNLPWLVSQVTVSVQNYDIFFSIIIIRFC